MVIADDLTFTLEKTGQNLEGEDFVMLVTGTVTEDGALAFSFGAMSFEEFQAQN